MAVAAQIPEQAGPEGREDQACHQHAPGHGLQGREAGKRDAQRHVGSAPDAHGREQGQVGNKAGRGAEAAMASPRPARRRAAIAASGNGLEDDFSGSLWYYGNNIKKAAEAAPLGCVGVKA